MTKLSSCSIVGVAVLACLSCVRVVIASEEGRDELREPAELRQLVGEGVGLDRLITLARELSATSEVFVNELGFNVTPGQIFNDGFAVNYIFFHQRPLFEILSIYDKQLALEKWGDVEVRFLEKQQGGFQIGIGVSDIPRVRQHVNRLNLTEQGALGSPAQTVFTGVQEPFENKAAVVLGEEQRDPHHYVVPVFFTNYTYTALNVGRERRPEDRHPALRNTHPNTATRIAAAYLAVDNLDKAISAYEDLGFTSVVRGEHKHLGARTATLNAINADVVLLEPLQPDGIVGNFLRERGTATGAMGVSIAVQDLELARSIVEHNTGRSMVSYDTGYGPSFLVPPEITSDVYIEFVQE